MIETLKQLIRLQSVDYAILAVNKGKNEGPKHIKEIEAHLQSLQDELNKRKETAEALTRRREELESELSEVREYITKSQAKSSNVKNEKEYRAILKEIDDLKRSMKSIEDDILNVMEEQESKQLQIQEQELLCERDLAKAKKNKQELEEKVRSAENELAVLQGKRDEITEKIDQRILDQYDFIRKNKDGVALAGVTKGICSVCHMNLPPQRFNELLRNDRLLTCPSCQRIIYWKDHEELQAELAQGAPSS